jgi:hypothetical protein
MTEQIPEQRERYDQHHGYDRAAADSGHSMTSYAKATPCGSFSANRLSAASSLALLTLRQLCDVERGIAQRNELAPVRRLDWIKKLFGPKTQ